MSDAYMGWTLDYARRMLPLLAPFCGLGWLEEPGLIPDDIGGYAALKAMGTLPIAGGEHEFTIYGFDSCLRLGQSITFSSTQTEWVEIRRPERWRRWPRPTQCP